MKRTPLRIPCASIAEVPPVEQLALLATEEHHVVLVFPDSAEMNEAKKKLIERLTAEMPDHSVFDSGGRSSVPRSEDAIPRWLRWLFRLIDPETNPPPPDTRVTVLKVLSEGEILSHAQDIVAAARQFRAVATELMTRLAQHLGVSVEAFADPLFREKYKKGVSQPRGTVDGVWEFCFHGFECGFRHRITGQDVDVKLGYWNEFGVLDPMFFAHFIRTTPGMEVLERLFQDDFHDPARALQVLEYHGYLICIDSHGERFKRSGLVARSEDSE